MYKRDRALKQQALRQHQQIMANCQMRIANGMDLFTSNSGEIPDIKPDPAFLMSVANSLGYGMNNVNSNSNINQSHHTTPGTSPTGSGIPSPTISENSPRDLRLSVPTSALSQPHGNLNSDSQESFTNTSGNFFPSSGNLPTSGYQSYYPAVPNQSNVPLLPQLLTDLKASALDESEVKNKLKTFMVSEFGMEEISASNYHYKMLRMLCRLVDQVLFIMVEWARTSVFFRELKVGIVARMMSSVGLAILLF